MSDCVTCGRNATTTICGECVSCYADPECDGAVTALRSMLHGMPDALCCLEKIVRQRDALRAATCALCSEIGDAIEDNIEDENARPLRKLLVTALNDLKEVVK